MDNIKELLPIGSVVILKGARKRLVIIGVKQADMTTNKVYDYLAIPYPEGFISQNNMLFVNNAAIEKVYHRGYEDEERDRFIEKLAEYYENQENNNN